MSGRVRYQARGVIETASDQGMHKGLHGASLQALLSMPKFPRPVPAEPRSRHSMTVSAFIITSADRHLLQHLDSQTPRTLIGGFRFRRLSLKDHDLMSKSENFQLKV
jgi:hypothetical protein